MKLVSVRKKLVIYFLRGFFFLCLNCQKPPLQWVEFILVPRMRFSVVVLSWMLDSRWSFTSRWISVCTEWPRTVDLGVEMINCDYVGFNASYKACVGSWLNTWRASHYWCPPCSGHSVIRTYARPFRVIFMPACELQSRALTVLKTYFLRVRYGYVYTARMESNGTLFTLGLSAFNYCFIQALIKIKKCTVHSDQDLIFFL